MLTGPKCVDSKMGSNSTIYPCQIQVQIWDERDRILPASVERAVSFSCPDLRKEHKYRPILERTISARERSPKSQDACLLWSSNCHPQPNSKLTPQEVISPRSLTFQQILKTSSQKVSDSGQPEVPNAGPSSTPAFPLAQVIPYLFVGSIEAAYSERHLCRFGIDCILDVSNRRPQDVPSGKKSMLSCGCPESQPHRRSRLCLHVEEDESHVLAQHTEEAIRFMEAACKSGRPVLVHCFSGNCRGPALVICYLMQVEGMSLQAAYKKVTKARPSVQLRPGYWTLLRRVEAKSANRQEVTCRVNAWC